MGAEPVEILDAGEIFFVAVGAMTTKPKYVNGCGDGSKEKFNVEGPCLSQFQYLMCTQGNDD